ncbi:hypothetical protein PR202_ga31611 [Eleusine coracana subsp. coracana]|uniref:Uncharacterized protein n=1 Tax=Eleusine coracana subsp. coracana TaxID=191504 RepID=A0AAV5DQE5_ELECO|nr:hypothetical protein PR202_ga31611 [Eleusine coracana subsp. coracana]
MRQVEPKKMIYFTLARRAVTGASGIFLPVGRWHRQIVSDAAGLHCEDPGLLAMAQSPPGPCSRVETTTCFVRTVRPASVLVHDTAAPSPASIDGIRAKLSSSVRHSA